MRSTVAAQVIGPHERVCSGPRLGAATVHAGRAQQIRVAASWSTELGLVDAISWRWHISWILELLELLASDDVPSKL